MLLDPKHAECALSFLPFLPLIGAALVYLLTNGCTNSEKKGRHVLSGWLATIFSAGAFVLVVRLFQTLNTQTTPIAKKLWSWFAAGNFHVDFAFQFDHLTAVMCLIITGVGSLIHLYAIGYMAHDEHRPRFFCYLNMFLFAMLLLVLGSNLLVMFVGWEGVGLCSYLLIGFWFKEMPNAEAGQKAFVVNRIGDAGFILGIFTLFGALGAVDFATLAQHVAELPPGVIELAALLLFVGAVGKSAQIPLFVWLPDAMAGPTPVSALIHAATMVTAGIYMITRMSFLYVHAPMALSVIAIVGTLTAFVAATIALVQNDIKKVLAYSTVSQLGYMFMALGAAAFSNGIYHVVTHAFFKACLFMGAGSVIMGCHHEQDMRKFGGLWKKMPLTFLTYMVATFAIAGFPGLSGFYSKDAILWTVFSSENLSHTFVVFGHHLRLGHLLWSLGAVTAFLTAFYMTRSLMMTFFGTYRGGHSEHHGHDDHHGHGEHHEPHESPWVVTLPLIILAALSAGFAYRYGESLMHYLGAWTRPDMSHGEEAFEHNHMFHRLEHLSMAIAISGMLLSAICYSGAAQFPVKLARALPNLYRMLLDKWRVDELYNAIIVRPLQCLAAICFQAFDRALIDGSVNGAGFAVEGAGEFFRRFQNGKIATYAAAMFGGALVMIIFWILA